MNATEQSHGSGNWIAFLFGAVFNLLASVDFNSLFDNAVQAIIGGLVCVIFNLLGDVTRPLWEDLKLRVKRFFSRFNDSNNL